jgi:hypothetical protein
MTTVQVIDVASWQHPGGRPIDFAKVYAAGFRGVMIKATQGTNYANPFFAQDYEQAKAAGLMVGAYHFCDMVTSPESEAAWFIQESSDGIVLELGRAADVEQPFRRIGVDLATWVESFLGIIDNPAGSAWLYTNRDGLVNLGGAPWTFKLWEAPGGVPADPRALMVQTGTGEVDGVEGLCDIDQLLSIRNVNPPDGGGGVPTPPAPPPDPNQPPTEVYPMQELTQGTSGTQVKVLQFVLNDKANADLATDGDFGPITEAAVMAFQTGAGLASDGVVGPLTWGALLS